MNSVIAIIVVMAAFLLIIRLRGRKGRRKLSIPVYSRRIEGNQVVAVLAPDMTTGCLFDHGVQFGKGFRRKEGPELPHGKDCRCKTVPFSFNSNEVFNGALRKFAFPESAIPGMEGESADRFLERIRHVESRGLPTSLEAYVSAVGSDATAPGSEQAVQEFLARRFDFLGRQKEPAALRSEPDNQLATDNQ